mmetsp:Transcript_7345/g.25218  ORF Transcript_7345/g.25218 Transcript_7345/m.25218 type:complete len:110 (+) Transcript_7345:329-658(+)
MMTIEGILRNELYINFCLRRTFWWYKSILWAEDIRTPAFIALSERDECVPVPAVQQYLSRYCDEHHHELDLVVFKKQGHGGFLSCTTSLSRIATGILKLRNDCEESCRR